MGYLGQDKDHLESPGTPSCDSLQTSNPMQSSAVGLPPGLGLEPCPRQFQGLFFCFSWGCQRPISAARTVTIWTLPNGPSLLQLEHTSLSAIAFLSGPTCDRANRVTQACRLKRIASEHDRRSGRIGDFTDHLCPCPSILRWALPCGREGLFSERWQDRSVASDFRNPVADSPPTSIVICIFARFHYMHRTPHLAGNSPRVRVLLAYPSRGSRFQWNCSSHG